MTSKEILNINYIINTTSIMSRRRRKKRVREQEKVQYELCEYEFGATRHDTTPS
jgi:hypothetical protein